METTEIREQDILKIVAQLDITPTMFKNADEKYRHLAEFLTEHGVEADFYPQGSFALGTVVKPSAKDPNAAYDLDAICQVRAIKDDIAPSELWQMIQEALESSEVYRSRLTVYDKCLTIQYADVGEYGFSIDIVPAADETDKKKEELRSESTMPYLMDTAIAIPKKTSCGHCWITNNPKGYRKWFEEINAPFAEFSRNSFRLKLFENNSMVFDSVEDIPTGLERSSVQRVIQLLKYHRDVYFSKRKDGDDIKPISAIINTLVARIAQKVSPALSVFELLDIVTAELATYSKQQFLDEGTFSKSYVGKDVILRQGGQWKIMNPANPQDNLADAWNKDPSIPFWFFKWAGFVRDDLISSLHLDEAEFRTKAENALGPANVQKVWGDRYKRVAPKPVVTERPAKPWREQ